MTSQQDIQSLISDIDSILPQANSGVPLSEPQNIDNLHQVLVKLRNFLVSLPSDNAVATSENLPAPVPQPLQETGEQVVEVVTQQMNSLRADVLSYLQADLDALRQQRQSLVQEIQQQEDTQRQLQLLNEQKTLQQQKLISEFSQELINRCSTNLSQKLAHILGNWEDRLLGNTSIAGARIPSPTNLGQGKKVRVSLDAKEELRQIQQHSDQMLSNLDANQRLIFEALQSNLQSYQQSLSKSMTKMHNLNSQVEGLCTELVERLVKQFLPSDLLLTNNQITTSQQNLQTLLPNQDWSIREQQVADLTLGLMVKPKSLLGNQMRLRLPPPEAEINPIPRNQVAGEDDQEASVYLPKEPGNSTDPPKQGILNSQELNMEELYWENLGIELDNHDLINSLIQLDINEQEEALSEDFLFPVAEERESPNPSDSEAQDSSSTHQAIDDLYSTLFGKDALTTTVELDESDSPPPFFDPLDQTTLGNSEAASREGNNPTLAVSAVSKLGVVNLALLDKLTPSTSVEEVLFEGFRDPAAEVIPVPTPELSLGNPGKSWELLFFEDSTAALPEEEKLARSAQTASPETILAPAEIDIITKLTDLLGQMGLNHLTLEEIGDVRLTEQIPNNETPVSVKDQQLPYPAVETKPQTNRVEEPYVPASKDEILLVEDELDSAPGLEIVLDENIIQQLSEDLGHFEEDEIQALPTQEENSSANDQETSPNTDVTENLANRQPRFSRSEELLAEDWEELSLNNEGEEIKVVRDETSFNLSTSEASELIESHFEPDLFPPEVPQLDQLNLVNDVGLDASVSETRGTESSNTSPTEEVVESSLVEEEDSKNLPAELLPIDDETFTEIFIEMLQDKPPEESGGAEERRSGGAEELES
ncbi:MAG: hypothetical protein F6J86_14820 [Symploca sp. SIO1B1]|nr:hypothetical protein [Symploca sp. SIO1B1]